MHLLLNLLLLLLVQQHRREIAHEPRLLVEYVVKQVVGWKIFFI